MRTVRNPPYAFFITRKIKPMKTYQQPLWGYELDLPDDWIHQTIQDTDGFSGNPSALNPGYRGSNLGHLLVRGEWNPTQQEIEPLWAQHITRLSTMVAAKNIGSAPWRMGGGHGFEAEIMLPKVTKKRLWVGILSYNATILHFMVSHWMEERQIFEPIVTKVISSLSYLQTTDRISTVQHGLPIPTGYKPVDPQSILDDVTTPELWQAYAGGASMDALQAFFYREVQNYGFNIEEYIPHPSSSDLGFARLILAKGDLSLTLGILPSGSKYPTGDIVIKTNPI